MTDTILQELKQWLMLEETRLKARLARVVTEYEDEIALKAIRRVRRKIRVLESESKD